MTQVSFVYFAPAVPAFCCWPDQLACFTLAHPAPRIFVKYFRTGHAALVSLLYCKCLPNLVWGRISSRATQERHGDQHRQPRHDAGNSPEDPPPDSTQTPAAPAEQQSQQSRLAERRRQLCGSECMCSERMASGRSSFSQAPQGVAGGNPEAHGHGGSARAAPSQQKVRR